MSGPQCCSNPPVLDPSGGAGHVEKLAGLDTYVTGSPHSKLAILLISDVFGTFRFPLIISYFYDLDHFTFFIFVGIDFHVVLFIGFFCILY